MANAQADQLSRLLGLVFAGADLVLEVDEQGRITFALGAAEALTGLKDAALMGRNWTKLVADGDGDVLNALMHGVAPGERRGPLRLTLAVAGATTAPRQVSISAFRMPGRNTLSAAVSLASLSSADFGRTQEGLVPAENFEAATNSMLAQAAQVGQAVRLELVELSGLRAKTDALPPEASAAMRRRVAATLRADSYAGVGASEIAPDRFALVRSANGSSERLADQLKAAAGEGVTPVIAALSLENGSNPVDPRAIRFALDQHIAEGAKAAQGGFIGVVERTMREGDRFRSMLETGSFRLVYQPVVDLKDERLHHFEALSRFEADKSPADPIRLAEELDLILDFDIAVARSVATTLAERPQVSIAANLSAGSLTNPRFTEALLAITDDRALRKRLLLEVTETRRIEDLGSAARSIDALRRAGFLVCLDDFGAGATSLDYLRMLTVDFVKIDGRFIRELSEDSREAILLKHLVRLCEDLHVKTVAEVIETRASASLAKKLGVTLGQGWVFGKPTDEPVFTDAQLTAPARRRGVVEGWS